MRCAVPDRMRTIPTISGRHGHGHGLLLLRILHRPLHPLRRQGRPGGAVGPDNFFPQGFFHALFKIKNPTDLLELLILFRSFVCGSGFTGGVKKIQSKYISKFAETKQFLQPPPPPRQGTWRQRPRRRQRRGPRCGSSSRKN